MVVAEFVIAIVCNCAFSEAQLSTFFMIEENAAEKLIDYLGGYLSSSILSALCLIILLVDGFNLSTDKQLNELTEHQPLKTGIDFWCRAEHI
jgi:branched-subunit amino acid transport protein AzlD